MGQLDTNGYYALGIPFYFAVIGVEILVARYQKREVYGFADTIGSFCTGLGEVIVGLFLGPILLGMYDFAYEHMAIVHWSKDSLIPWILAFALGDLCYYWYHRAGHHVAAFWAIHSVHHQTERFNVSVATRHPWFSDSYSFVFYIPVPVLGVPPLHFFIAISIISFYALTVHSQIFHRPGFWFLVTPATHIVHHAKNPRYMNHNYGAMFTLWDRMFGTHVEVDPADPPQLGTTFGYQTHDGARAQWVFFQDILAVARKAPTFADKVRAFIRHPGWTPEGMVFPKHPPPRSDAAIPTSTKIYTLCAFMATLAFGVYLLWLRDKHPVWLLTVGALVVLWGLSTLGGLLDGREGARTREGIRVAATLALGATVFITQTY